MRIQLSGDCLDTSMMSTAASSAHWEELSGTASISLPTTSHFAPSAEMPVTSTLLEQRSKVAGYQTVVSDATVSLPNRQFFISSLSNSKPNERAKASIPSDWFDQEYRTFFAEAAVEQDIAWQIKANRQHRKLSQAELATLLETRQSAVSRLEDPEYGQHSIDTLKKVAAVFDCALQVRLISFGKLHEESKDLTMESMVVPSFDEEFPLQNQVQNDKHPL